MTKRIPTADRTAMRRAKNLVFGGAKFSVVAIPESPARKKKSKSTKLLHGNLSKIIDQIAHANDRGYLIALLPHETDGKGAKAANVKGPGCLYVDIDSKFDKKTLMKLSVKPHLIYETSPGRGVALWKVSECTESDFHDHQVALANMLSADKSRTSLASLIRFPGTVHWKGDPFVTRILHIDKDAKPIAVKKFAKRMKLDVAKTPAIAEPTSGAGAQAPAAQEVKAALAAIPSELLGDRKLWRDLGMAIKSALPGADGLDIFMKASRNAPSFDEKELVRQWNSFAPNKGISIATLFFHAKEYGWMPTQQGEAGLPHSELELMDFAATKLREKVAFDTSTLGWLYYDGVCLRDGKANRGSVMRWLREIVAGGQAAARDSGDEDARALFNKYAHPASLGTLLKYCEHHEAVSIDHDKLNHDPRLFAVGNGVIDLKTTKLREGRIEDMITRRSSAAFDVVAKAPKFEKYLQEATGGDKELMRYLQVLTGYLLFGENHEQIIPVILGPGGSGKGVYTRVLKSIVGEYATAIAPNLLTNAFLGNPNSPKPAIMALDGPRVYICSEGSEGKLFDSAFMKKLAGGDDFPGRSAYEGQVVFRPRGKLVLTTNILPHVDAADDAMWRRLIVIPFDVQPKRRNADLSVLLESEVSGILNWALAGATEYLKRGGLPDCKKVRRATRAARESGDTINNWLAACCKVKKGGRIQSSTAHESYSKYSKANGQRPIAIQNFPEAMKKKGYPHIKTRKHTLFEGLVLID